jgi:hypothetical protein
LAGGRARPLAAPGMTRAALITQCSISAYLFDKNNIFAS